MNRYTILVVAVVLAQVALGETDRTVPATKALSSGKLESIKQHNNERRDDAESPIAQIETEAPSAKPSVAPTVKPAKNKDKKKKDESKNEEDVAVDEEDEATGEEDETKDNETADEVQEETADVNEAVDEEEKGKNKDDETADDTEEEIVEEVETVEDEAAEDEIEDEGKTKDDETADEVQDVITDEDDTADEIEAEAVDTEDTENKASDNEPAKDETTESKTTDSETLDNANNSTVPKATNNSTTAKDANKTVAKDANTTTAESTTPKNANNTVSKDANNSTALKDTNNTIAKGANDTNSSISDYIHTSENEPDPYQPGNLVVRQNGLLLSQGLSVRIIAEVDKPVKYDVGGESKQLCHHRPDFGATFVDYREDNPDGYIYVSNCEDMDTSATLGGVGAFTFDKDGQLFDYRMVLTESIANCGGGRTPWGAWISCEEHYDGVIWQVDPTGERKAETITLGDDNGVFESFTYDIRNKTSPKFYVTEDRWKCPLRQFVPHFPDWSDPWSILTGPGETKYLMLYPDETSNAGTFDWIDDKQKAISNAVLYYPNTEGIDAMGNELYFVSKRYKSLYVLDLDTGVYNNYTTVRGLFNSQPDQIMRILGDRDEILYFTEDATRGAGIHGRAKNGTFFTILENDERSGETTGLAFSPDLLRMYFAIQQEGILFEVSRDDGKPFAETTMNLRYHTDTA